MAKNRTFLKMHILCLSIQPVALYNLIQKILQYRMDSVSVTPI